MKKLSKSDITLGEPIAFSLVDASGRLLLRKGHVINTPDIVDKLIKCSAFKQENAALRLDSDEATGTDNMSVFDRMDGLLLNFKYTLDVVLKTPDLLDLQARIKNFAVKIQSLCHEDVDAALASPYLDTRNPYIVVHQVMGAILTEIMAARKGLTAEERLPHICAALTRDIGQLYFQSNLDKYDSQLPPALKRLMLEHPSRGAEMLGQAGVTDIDWLNAVRMHHERLDGSGYPLMLRGDDIGLGARMLAIADIYSAMTKLRPYRSKTYPPQGALREIYLEKDTRIDSALVQMLIKGIGMMPPGSIVRLKNNEIAVVKSCTLKTAEATVYSLYDKHGEPLFDPASRDTRLPGFEIVGTVPFSECQAIAVVIKRLWTK